MSKTVSLSMEICQHNGDDVQVSQVVRALLEAGWRMEINGQVRYLPVGPEDEGDYVYEERTVPEILDILDAKQRLGEFIGLSLFWGDTLVGGTLFVSAPNRQLYDFGLSSDRRYLDQNNRLLDTNWYIEKVVPCLMEKFNVFRYTMDVSFCG